jgi:hypothetical protein
VKNPFLYLLRVFFVNVVFSWLHLFFRLGHSRAAFAGGAFMKTGAYGRSIAITALILVVGLVASTSSYAQGGTSTATLSGRIVDDTGGRLPGVTVTVTHAATNRSRAVVSNEEGLYRFAGLAPGTYALKAELPSTTAPTWRR